MAGAEPNIDAPSQVCNPVRDATIIIVENNLKLLTLPSLPRGMGIRGEGNSVNRLELLCWLDANRVLYWGDIDVEGFIMLSRLRNLFSSVESVMMDMGTIRQHERLMGEGTGSEPASPTNLTSAEADALGFCLRGNRRLEQERIPQPTAIASNSLTLFAAG